MKNLARFFRFILLVLIAAVVITAVIKKINSITSGFSEQRNPVDIASTATEGINVLMLGIDSEGGHADFIMLANYIPKNRRITLLSIPRDTRVNTERSDSKINSAYKKGQESILLKEIEQITGILPQYYIAVDLKGLRAIIDAIGGIKIDVPIDMDYDDPLQNLHIHLDKGLQVLDGSRAEQFVRFRKNNDGTGYTNGDIDRIKMQQKFLRAAAEQFVKPSNLIKLPQLVGILLSNVSTNLTAADITKHLTNIFIMRKENVRILTLPGEAKYIGGVSYFIHNEKKTQNIVQNNFYFSAEDSVPEEEDVALDISQIRDEDAGLSFDKCLGKVEVLNATDIPGLANKVAERLSEEGYDVKKVGNYYTRRHIFTQIIERTDNIDGKEINRLLKCGVISNQPELSDDVDITIIIGADYRSQ